MCQKAKEIQEQWDLDDGSNYVAIIHDGYAMTDVSLGYITNSETKILKAHDQGEGRVWLPRQDQLQDMLMDDSKDYGHIVHLFVEYLCDTTDYHGGIRFADVDIYGDFTSFEQLWLAFLMDEKYSKYWNGKDWVLEGD
jgi:hypothetical protein